MKKFFGFPKKFHKYSQNVLTKGRLAHNIIPTELPDMLYRGPSWAASSSSAFLLYGETI